MNTPVSGAIAAPDPGWTRKARRDLAAVVIVSAAAAILCVKLNLSELLLSFTRPEERFQLDELPGILLVVALCLSWFSARRYGEARRELALRRAAETRLSAALDANRRLAQQYIDVQESEHRALARDLHDELGQYLNAIKLDAVELRARLAALAPAAGATAITMIDNIDRVQGVVLGLIRQLRPVGLDELGLRAALEHFVQDWRGRLPALAIGLSLSERLDELDERHRLTVYRLVQEALTNIARHARATRAEICIERSAAPAGGEHIEIRIADNGGGADPSAGRTGLGLLGMRERVEALGGSLTLASAPGAGFTLTARLPVGSPA